LVLNKTNSFYAVNFWYLILTFFLLVRISKINNPKFLNLKNSILIIIPSIIFGLTVNIIIAERTWSHNGPNLNLFNNTYYNASYRTKVVNKFLECCGDLPKDSYVVDDASYFILKKEIKYPTPITYAGIFGDDEAVYSYRKIKYIITRCDALNKYEFKGDMVDGGYGNMNICFKKYIP
jgi:hypothetical protein